MDIQRLVIIDFSDTSVHFFDLDPKIDVDDEFIENLGFHTSNCSWMTSESMHIEFHNGVLR